MFSFLTAVLLPYTFSYFTSSPFLSFAFYTVIAILIQLATFIFGTWMGIYFLLLKILFALIASVIGWSTSYLFMKQWCPYPFFRVMRWKESKWGTRKIVLDSPEQQKRTALVSTILVCIFIMCVIYELVYLWVIIPYLPSSLTCGMIWGMDITLLVCISVVIMVIGIIPLCPFQYKNLENDQKCKIAPAYSAFTWLYSLMLIPLFLTLFGLFMKYIPGLISYYDDIWVFAIILGMFGIYSVILNISSFLVARNESAISYPRTMPQNQKNVPIDIDINLNGSDNVNFE